MFFCVAWCTGRSWDIESKGQSSAWNYSIPHPCFLDVFSDFDLLSQAGNFSHPTYGQHIPYRDDNFRHSDLIRVSGSRDDASLFMHE